MTSELRLTLSSVTFLDDFEPYAGLKLNPVTVLGIESLFFYRILLMRMY